MDWEQINSYSELIFLHHYLDGLVSLWSGGEGAGGDFCTCRMKGTHLEWRTLMAWMGRC